LIAPSGSQLLPGGLAFDTTIENGREAVGTVREDKGDGGFFILHSRRKSRRILVPTLLGQTAVLIVAIVML
jgi:hypothetical protein